MFTHQWSGFVLLDNIYLHYLYCVIIVINIIILIQNEVVEPDPNALKFLAEMQMATGKNTNIEESDLKICECEACKDRR